MSFTVISNFTYVNSADPINENYYYISHGTRLPYGGANLDPTGSVYNIGSETYRWNRFYYNTLTLYDELVINSTVAFAGVTYSSFFDFSGNVLKHTVIDGTGPMFNQVVASFLHMRSLWMAKETYYPHTTWTAIIEAHAITYDSTTVYGPGANTLSTSFVHVGIERGWLQGITTPGLYVFLGKTYSSGTAVLANPPNVRVYLIHQNEWGA